MTGRKIKHVLFLLTCLFLLAFSADHKQTVLNQPGILFDTIYQKLNKLSIPFIENSGQLNAENIKYYTNIPGGRIFVQDDGHLIYAFSGHSQASQTGWALKESFGKKTDLKVVGKKPSETRISYFKGKQAPKWTNNINTYKYIDFGEIYSGIELKLQAGQNNFEKLFYVKPHAKPEVIRVKLEDVQKLAVNSKAELEATTEFGTIRFTKPVGFQYLDDKEEEIAVRYWVEGDEYGFLVDNYDESRPLVIDPLLASTFLGGAGEASEAGEDIATDMVLDAAGNVYVTGRVKSFDFPTIPGAFDTDYNQNGDIFISRFDANLENLLASTFIGGGAGWDGNDIAHAITIDAEGNIYIVGETGSSDFPTTANAYDTTFQGTITDAFVAKLDGSLQNLLASTFLGGGEGFTGEDVARKVAIAPDGNVYVTGRTAASDFPTTEGAFQTDYNNGSFDAFVAALDKDLQHLVCATFLGGAEKDDAQALSISSSGEIFLTGYTHSTNFPTTANALDTSFNGPNSSDSDVFLAKLDAPLQNLQAATFLGHEWSEKAAAIQVASTGNVFVAGWTGSAAFPTTPNAYDTSYNEAESSFYGFAGDVFVAKLDADFQNLLASTVLGSTEKDFASTLAIGKNGEILVGGFTESAQFPTTPQAFDTSFGNHDGFIAKFSNDLQHLSCSTLLGGQSEKDGVSSLVLNQSGEIYATGYTYAADFPTTNQVFDKTYNDFGDIFLTRFDTSLALQNEVEHLWTFVYDNGNYRYRLWITNFNTGRSCFVRFSPVSTVTLKTAKIRLSGYNRSSSDIRVMVLDQNRDSLGVVDVPFTQLQLGAWNTIDLAALNLTVDQDFYIGVGLTSPNETDSLWISGDEGPGLTERSFVRYSKTWYDANSDYNWDLNMMIRATIWSETEVKRIPPAGLPDNFALFQNYPNPFNLRTNINFQLPKSSALQLKILNSLGQEIRTLVDSEISGGFHQVVWDGQNNQGQIVGSGIYFYQLITPGYRATKRMLLLK